MFKPFPLTENPGLNFNLGTVENQGMTARQKQQMNTAPKYKNNGNDVTLKCKGNG